MTTRLPYHSVVFDLDGTLLHTWPGLLAAVDNSGLLPSGSFDRTALMRALSVGIDAMFLEAIRQADLKAEATPAALAGLRRDYEDRWLDQAEPYADAGALLGALVRAGWQLGVCTNRDSRTTQALLQRLGWSGHFAAVTCIDQIDHPKPDARHLLAVIEALDSEPGTCLYVGDSALDARCAAAAQVDFVSHAAGYHLQPQDLQPHLFSFSHHSELLRWLEVETTSALESSHG